jgi:hypothetical protein
MIAEAARPERVSWRRHEPPRNRYSGNSGASMAKRAAGPARTLHLQAFSLCGDTDREYEDAC